MTNPDVIVVGAGIGGLQLAALLASDSNRVQVVEKLDRIGGRAFLWDKAGFTVDNGIHVIRFGPHSATARVFCHIGRDIDFVPIGKCYARLADGRVVDFPADAKGLLTTGLMSKGERLEALALLARLRGLSLAGHAADLADRLAGDSRDPKRGARERLGGALASASKLAANVPLPLGLDALDDEQLLDTSVAEWMNQLGITGGLRQYFHLICASMQVCPDVTRASAGEMLFNLGTVLDSGSSATYPRRGWRHLFDSLRNVIEERGEIRTSAEVKRVLIEEGAITGVELANGERLLAPTVVINLPSQQLFEVLDESLVPMSFVETCKGQRPTCGVVLDYGLERRISEDSGVWYLAEPASFGLFTSNLCPEVAPPGKQLLTWMQPTEPEELADKKRAQQIEERLEAALFTTFPALEKNIAWRRARHLRMMDGVEINTTQHRRRRPRYRVPGVKGLFLVGDTLAAAGAGGDVGHESVLCCYQEMTGRPV